MSSATFENAMSLLALRFECSPRTKNHTSICADTMKERAMPGAFGA